MYKKYSDTLQNHASDISGQFIQIMLGSLTTLIFLVISIYPLNWLKFNTYYVIQFYKLNLKKNV